MVLDQLRLYYTQWNIPIMSLATQQYVVSLLSYCRPKTVLEIWTAVWFGSMIIANEIQKRWWQIYTYEISYPNYYKAIHHFVDRVLWWYPHNIYAYNLNALDHDYTKHCNKKIDFAWIDGQKSEYSLYINSIIPHLALGWVCVLDDVITYQDSICKIYPLLDALHCSYQIIQLDDNDGICIVHKL